MIRLKESEWEPIKQRLAAEYPPSVMLLRYRMRDVLGFVVRNHHEWVNADPRADNVPGYRGHYRDWVCLDFYDPAKETFFRLKYL